MKKKTIMKKKISMVACPDCNGTGKRSHMSGKDCLRCEGDGNLKKGILDLLLTLSRLKT